MLTLPLLLVYAGATLFMTGLIWFVQIVHYPLLQEVGPDRFRAYSQMHQRRTTWVVAPVMLLEMTTTAALPMVLPQGTARTLGWLGLALLVIIWLSTALLQVPSHQRLLSGFDQPTWSRLVRSNWLRTLGWTLRSVIALGMLNPGVIG